MIMSGQQYNQRRKPRGGSAQNYIRRGPKPQQEKSVLNDGIYRNERYMHTATSLVGYSMKVKVKNERVYEGIFKTFSPQMDVVLERAHIVDGTRLPSRENIVHTMVINWKDIVNMHVHDVDPDAALLGADGFTDSAISSRYNGRPGERELQPWDANSEEGPMIDSGSLDDDANANGWDANLMFKTNESKFNIKSRYDPSLKEYTTELQKADTEEYRTREAIAERQAKEIEGSSTYSENMDLENGDEEMRYSAVHRPEEAAPATVPGNGVGAPGKYVVPQHRTNAQPSVLPAQRPQQLVMMPEAMRGQLQPAHPPNPTENVVTSSGMMRLNAGDACKEEMERPPPMHPGKMTVPPAAAESSLDKSKGTVGSISANTKPEQLLKPRNDTIQELREFNKNFKMTGDNDQKETKQSVSSGQPSTQVALPQSQLSQPPAPSQQMPLEQPSRLAYDDREDNKEESKEDISKKSSLNPLAKEFSPAVKQHYPTRNLPPQTPPRPPSTVSSPPTVYYPVSVVPQTPAYPTMLGPPVSAQPTRTAVSNKRASVSVSRPEVNPPPQAMTGAPLITQPVMFQGGPMIPGSTAMMPIYQPVIRMLPQHPQNVVIDHNPPTVLLPVASSLTSHQPPHPGAGVGPATHHMIPGSAMQGTVHTPHGAGVAPQQTSGAPTPTPMHQYGQPPQAGSAMPLPTTSGTPQPPHQIQMFPGGPLAISHPPQMHPTPGLQHINNPNPTSPIIYQALPFSQFTHQTPGMAYAAAAAAAGQQSVGQPQVGAGQQPIATPHQPPPSGIGHSSQLMVHGPAQMVMAPQPQGAGGPMAHYMSMPGIPAGMTQAPNLAQHPVSFPMYGMPGPQTFTLGQ